MNCDNDGSMWKNLNGRMVRCMSCELLCITGNPPSITKNLQIDISSPKGKKQILLPPDVKMPPEPIPVYRLAPCPNFVPPQPVEETP